MRLRGLSFHSVKGGVGKSTLATIAAIQSAREHPGRPVYLIDMDLTGTSLADVLPLRAPRWEGRPSITPQLLESQAPIGFDTPEDSRTRVDQRDQELRARRHDRPEDLFVPLLNDFLMHDPSEYDPSRDVRVDALCWQLDPGLPNLHVMPSSAIPGDLDRIVPVIFDEQHGALLEARFEALLAKIADRTAAERTSGATVVVDVPPTIPGLSRSVISLGLRLSREEKQPLSVKGGVPHELEGAAIDWTAHLVASPDLQDLRATERWLGLVLEEERSCFRFVINRHKWVGAADERLTQLRQALGLARTDAPSADPLRALNHFEPYLEGALFVPFNSAMEFFRSRTVPESKLDLGRLE